MATPSGFDTHETQVIYEHILEDRKLKEEIEEAAHLEDMDAIRLAAYIEKSVTREKPDVSPLYTFLIASALYLVDFRAIANKFLP